MKRLAIILLAGLSTFAFTGVTAQEDDEEKAIRETIQLYFKGDSDRDVKFLKEAFHPTARLLTSDKNGNLAAMTQSEWYELVNQTPDREKPTVRILSIDRAGNAAMAKTQLIRSNGTFIDFLSLLKINSGWIIVNKIYHWQEN
ncbi:MAG TPA: nuclear transport factor 2 family protein [Acidobacteriota bacterium]|nr:nuclear transport factor 2 family protein [Acidobacteriota bacterium]